MLRPAVQDFLGRVTNIRKCNSGSLSASVSEVIERAWRLETLQRSEKQFRLLSSKLMEAQENERKRLAHELHDSVGASLTAVKLGLERELSRAKGGNRPRNSGLLEELVSTVEETIKDLKRIYSSLRPLILDDLGVLPAIRSLIRQFVELRPHVEFKETFTASQISIFHDFAGRFNGEVEGCSCGGASAK